MWMSISACYPRMSFYSGSLLAGNSGPGQPESPLECEFKNIVFWTKTMYTTTKVQLVHTVWSL